MELTVRVKGDESGLLADILKAVFSEFAMEVEGDVEEDAEEYCPEYEDEDLEEDWELEVETEEEKLEDWQEVRTSGGQLMGIAISKMPSQEQLAEIKEFMKFLGLV